MMMDRCAISARPEAPEQQPSAGTQHSRYSAPRHEDSDSLYRGRGRVMERIESVLEAEERLTP